jgi:hypothetical protein
MWRRFAAGGKGLCLGARVAAVLPADRTRCVACVLLAAAAGQRHHRTLQRCSSSGALNPKPQGGRLAPARG